MTMIVVGLVGRIGAGKSTVARRFAEHGAEVIDADALAHAVLAEPDVVREVVARFGADVVDDAGRVRRGALAAAVFGDGPEQMAALRALEAIVHPRVRRRIRAALDAVAAAPTSKGRPHVVVLDVPLLVQAGWDDLCDRLVVVQCDEAVRRARLVARGWSDAQIAARDRAWERGGVPVVSGPKSRSVDAGADPAYTGVQVDRVWSELHGE
jgi:dephospho-CoA kinase